MKLQNLYEIVGTLEDINTKDDKVSLTFSYRKTIEIPKDALPIDKLNNCKTKEIGIFNLDGKYYLREVDDWPIRSF